MPVIRVYPQLSPRIVEVLPETSAITVQEIYDALRDWEDEPQNMSYPFIVQGAGKEDLGGGTSVGITITLQNARLMFTGRTTPLVASGTCEISDPKGKTLYAVSGVDFVTSGLLYPGCTVYNKDTQSMASVTGIISDTELGHFPLSGGSSIEWTAGDTFVVYPNVQADISGGNVVAVDTTGATIPPIFPSPNVQVVRSASSSATLSESGGGQSAAVIADQVWDEVASDHIIPGSMADQIRHIPKDIGPVYYVDGNTGDNSNTGTNPHDAFLTMAYAFSQIGNYSTLRIGSATYSEDGLVLNLHGCHLIACPGAVIEPSTGPALVVSGNANHIFQLAVEPAAAQIGYKITGRANFLNFCFSKDASIGFDIDGSRNNFIQCKSITHDTAGYDISADHNLFHQCLATNSGTTTRGFYFSTAGADHNFLDNCATMNNVTASYEFVAGANNNTIIFSAYSENDGPVINNGTGNTIQVSIADQVWDEPVADHVSTGSFGHWVQKKLLSVAKFLGLK